MDPGTQEATSECLNRSLFNASLDSSVLSTSCSPGGINPRRRESKSRAEKKRRDRINVCFQRMHELLEEESRCCSGRSLGPGDSEASGPAANQSPGPEKAEILERIIQYVEQLKRDRERPQQLADASGSSGLGGGCKASASTPERARPIGNSVDDSLIKSFMSGYKRGIQNIFILIDRLCNESERLTKTELIEKLKKGYLDNTDSPAVESDKLATAAAAVAAPALASAPGPGPGTCRPALGDLSNHKQPGAGESPTPKKSSAAATATAAAALIELSVMPVNHGQLAHHRQHQPPAKKRRAFREQQTLLQLLPPPPPPLPAPLPPQPLLLLQHRHPAETPHYEPISPGPYESPVHGGGDENSGVGVWRPW